MPPKQNIFLRTPLAPPALFMVTGILLSTFITVFICVELVPGSNPTKDVEQDDERSQPHHSSTVFSRRPTFNPHLPSIATKLHLLPHPPEPTLSAGEQCILASCMIGDLLHYLLFKVPVKTRLIMNLPKLAPVVVVFLLFVVPVSALLTCLLNFSCTHNTTHKIWSKPTY